MNGARVSLARAFRLGGILGLAITMILPGLSYPQGTGTIYTQTTHQCTLKSCADAQFTPAATLSYITEAEYCGQQDFGGQVTWNGTEYTDFLGSISFLGYNYNGHNYYPYGIYELRGTFNAGQNTLVEHMKTYRGCAGGLNLDGQVTQ